MRNTTKALIQHYVDHLDISGDVLEIGGFRLDRCAAAMFPQPRFRYRDTDIEVHDIPDAIIADITDCRAEIPDESFDLVISSDVFEHIDRPWLAAAEIARILKPGGVVVTHTLFSWRNHPCPIDYWRYSAECLEFLFADLDCLEKGYDLSQRRDNQPGFWASGNDSVPVDAFGGWREHWSVYCVNRKGTGPAVPRFKDSGHRHAHHLRRDTQGTVTNPTLLGLPDSDLVGGVAGELAKLRQQVAELSAANARQAQQLDKRVIDLSRPLPLRAYRRFKRARAGR